MVNAFSLATVALTATAAVTSGASMRSEAAPMPTGTWPKSQGDEFFDEPYVVKRGEVFDGKIKTYQRSNVKCAGQTESGWETAVFRVEPGVVLDDLVGGRACATTDHLGHAAGRATLDAQRVLAHVVPPHVLDRAAALLALYRSCGTCGYKNLKVNVKNVYAVNGRVSLVTVNQNWGDEATIENVKIKGKKINVCSWSDGTTSGGEPGEAGAGPSGKLCNYSPSTITYA
ncbi:hypothetical protein PR001_g28296 [Phytophthora rubi]|uniref:Probable pectate lyase F n=1 Tax=Phytophthora rubi TaxID=129364 RepID=A0A6A3HDV6_9STRA|nr:hypothetical protein PR001_g28296 [Phytophthora rubi]